jgi:hypothetical protein
MRAAESSTLRILARLLGRGVAAVLAAAYLTLPVAAAQTDREPALKAEFLLNFARFTDWPAEVLPGLAPLSICVAGDSAVADALAALVDDKTLAGRPLVVRMVISAASMPPCHILYVAAHRDAEDGALRAAFTQPAVLSISDEKFFARAGGIVELSVDDNKMQFAVNVDAVRRAGLHVSSRLLDLATIVRDVRW